MRWDFWFKRRKWEQQMHAEFRFHLENQINDYIRQGLSREEAELRACREFGALELAKDERRDQRPLEWLADLLRDFRYACRSLRRSPGFLAVSVLSLALGIGANTAIFSLIDALMLRSFPVKDPQRLVHITRVDSDGQPAHVSWLLFLYFRGNMKSISGAAAETEANPAIIMDGADEVVSAELVSGNQYTMLGVEPVAGRLLQPVDDTITPASPAAVISYRYWRRRFALNPSVIGKTFTVQNPSRSQRVIGIEPHGPARRNVRGKGFS
jgi:hypothetical protein